MRATSTSNRVIARNSGKLAARAANAVRENPSRRWRINTILVPVDFSAGSMPAYEFALDLAEQYEARVHLLHVLETATWSDFEKFPLVRDSELVPCLLLKGRHVASLIKAEYKEGYPRAQRHRNYSERQLHWLPCYLHRCHSAASQD